MDRGVAFVDHKIEKNAAKIEGTGARNIETMTIGDFNKHLSDGKMRRVDNMGPTCRKIKRAYLCEVLSFSRTEAAGRDIRNSRIRLTFSVS